MTYTEVAEVEFDFCPSCQELSGWCTCPGRTAAATNGLVQQGAQVTERLIREHQLDEPPSDDVEQPEPPGRLNLRAGCSTGGSSPSYPNRSR